MFKFRRVTCLALIATALSSLPGCAGYFSDRGNDLADIPIVGAGWGGLVMFGPGGGLELRGKFTELFVPGVGGSEMKEFEFVDGDYTTFEERSLEFPFATIYNLLTGMTPQPPVAVRQGRQGFLGFNLREYYSDYVLRYAQANTIDVPVSMRDDINRSMLMGTEGYEGLNHWWLVTPWEDSRLPIIQRFNVQVEGTFAMVSLKLGLSMGQFVDFFAGWLGFDPAHDDEYSTWWQTRTGGPLDYWRRDQTTAGDEDLMPLTTRPRSEGVLIEELNIIYFDYDSDELDDEDRQRLEENVDWILQNPDLPILIEGHCDERGTQEYNYSLGERRANAAYSYLRSRGVTNELAIRSYGEDRPAREGHDESAWQWNRRAQFSRYAD